MPDVKILNAERFRNVAGGRRKLATGRTVPMTDSEARAAVVAGYGEIVPPTSKTKASAPARKTAKKPAVKKAPAKKAAKKKAAKKKGA